MREWMLVITGMLLSAHLVGADYTFHRVAARRGDGVLALLRRYELDRHSCNLNQFYDLNKLSRTAGLIEGRLYFLPITLWQYNGKSIRSTIGINDWTQAVRIQKFNERMLDQKLRNKTFQSSKILWVPYHELQCPEEISPASAPVAAEPATAPEPLLPEESDEAVVKKGPRYFPIFGEKWAYTPLKSNKLKGQVFYISTGHGGPDPGAMSRKGNFSLCEDEYAYDVGLRLVRHLVAYGATTYMINRDPNDGIRSGERLACDNDEVLWGNVRMVRQQKPRLFQRSDIINDLYDRHAKQGITVQKALYIHVDSRNQKEQTDVFFYYFPGDEAARKMALGLHGILRNKYAKYQGKNRYSGSVTSRDLHMLRETKTQSVYVELANIKNPYDQKRILLESNREALARWLFEGMVGFAP